MPGQVSLIFFLALVCLIETLNYNLQPTLSLVKFGSALQCPAQQAICHSWAGQHLLSSLALSENLSWVQALLEAEKYKDAIGTGSKERDLSEAHGLYNEKRARADEAERSQPASCCFICRATSWSACYLHIIASAFTMSVCSECFKSVLCWQYICCSIS